MVNIIDSQYNNMPMHPTATLKLQLTEPSPREGLAEITRKRLNKTPDMTIIRTPTIQITRSIVIVTAVSKCEK